MSPRPEWGSYVRQVRESSGKDRNSLASQSQVPEHLIYLVETVGLVPSLEATTRILRALRVDVDLGLLRAGYIPAVPAPGVCSVPRKNPLDPQLDAALVAVTHLSASDQKKVGAYLKSVLQQVRHP